MIWCHCDKASTERDFVRRTYHPRNTHGYRARTRGSSYNRPRELPSVQDVATGTNFWFTNSLMPNWESSFGSSRRKVRTTCTQQRSLYRSSAPATSSWPRSRFPVPRRGSARRTRRVSWIGRKWMRPPICPKSWAPVSHCARKSLPFNHPSAAGGFGSTSRISPGHGRGAF